MNTVRIREGAATSPADAPSRPWLRLCGALPASIVPAAPTGLALARQACAQRAEQPLLHYFDTALSGAQVDAASDALAVALAGRGLGAGDRVAVSLQNLPGDYLTADTLDRSAAWRSALPVERGQVEEQLRSDGLGAPPWGPVSAVVRRAFGW